MLVLAREEGIQPVSYRTTIVALDDIAREMVAEYATGAIQRSIDLGVIAPHRVLVAADESSIRSLLRNYACVYALVMKGSKGDDGPGEKAKPGKRGG